MFSCREIRGLVFSKQGNASGFMVGSNDYQRAGVRVGIVEAFAYNIVRFGHFRPEISAVVAVAAPIYLGAFYHEEEPVFVLSEDA